MGWERQGYGRSARLLTTLILHLGGHGLKGLYALEEYYARDLTAYYLALTVGPSQNYYMGRAEADITGWVAYFIEGMAQFKGPSSDTGYCSHLSWQQRWASVPYIRRGYRHFYVYADIWPKPKLCGSSRGN